MDIKIPNSWLNKFLKTNATPQKIAKYLSLCGPSIEKVEKTKDGDFIYSIEITTNRVDTASVYGIAREAFAILPRFKINSKLDKLNTENSSFKFLNNVNYLNVTIDDNLCSRFSAVLIKNVKVKDSPEEIKSLLEKVGVKPINNIVDASNFIMHEIGQPVHTFDYDKIKNSKMILRESKKGESIITLDGKTFKLPGKDIVIEDGEGKLIDLCGIMGAKNSEIDENTKNCLVFVQTYNKNKIRQTSMSLAQRSEAAVLFEKGLDEELVKPAILSAIFLIEKLSNGKAEKEIIDIYKKPYIEKFISTDTRALEKIIGIGIEKIDITNYLKALGFEVFWNKDNLKVKIPSFRANDINIPEDIAEEIARIYGYQNIPSEIMSGKIPNPIINNSFEIENKIKNILVSLGSYEVYNTSLVSRDYVDDKAILIKNPLGEDSKYLRTSLKKSLVESIDINSQDKFQIHMFEIANIYIKRLNDLPEERLMLSGAIKNSSYRESKGIIQTLLNELYINYIEIIEDGKGYWPNQRLIVKSNSKTIGEYGNLENGLFYYEFSIDNLINSKKIIKKYHSIDKFPPQIEDLTLVIPDKTYIGDVIHSIKDISKLINNIELGDIFENSYTFRIWYKDINKTLTDLEVKKVREEIIRFLKSKFGIVVKS